MSLILAHSCVPDARRTIAATQDGLSGNIDEYSVELDIIPGGPAADWNTFKGYGTAVWWGASQAYPPEVAQAMLASGEMLQTEGFFAAFYDSDGSLIQHNLPAPPVDSSFDAFLAGCGLERVEVIP